MKSFSNVSLIAKYYEYLKIACNQDPGFQPNTQDYGKLGKVLGRGIWTSGERLRYARELENQKV